MTVHVLDAADLAASITAAQAALEAAPDGAADVWLVPPGVHDLAAGIVAGAAGRGVTIRGDDATLTVGAAAPAAGSAVVLDLVGTHVAVEGLTLRARAVADATALRIRTTDSCRVVDVHVAVVEGGQALGVDAAGPSGWLGGLVVEGVTATAGEAAGIVLDDGMWALARVTVRQVGGATAHGVRATTTSLTGTELGVGELAAGRAEGLLLRCTDELSLLDVEVDQITGSAWAAGLVAVCAGDVAIRGVGVATVEGGQAAGAVVVGGHEVDWSGGRLTDVRGTTGGAAGVRVLAAPERTNVRLADLSIEQVAAEQPGLVAEPSGSWRMWLDTATVALATGADLPDWPVAGDPGHEECCVGIHVCAPVPDGTDWLETTDSGPVELTQCVVERISGTAIQVVADLRNVELRGLLLWTAARAGHVEGERVLVAQCTLHRVGFGLGFGPCTLVAADTLSTGVTNGTGFVAGPETELGDVLEVMTTGGLPPFDPEPTPLPYVDPGPDDVPAELIAGDVVPAAPHDLRVDDALHARAQRVPGDDDDAPVWMGALAPDADTRCALRDPAPPPAEPTPAPARPGPVADYRARDARSLLTLMTTRAQQTMPGWTPDTVADQTLALMELFAERLDHIAYEQEVALSEGTVATALQRRSVEDHVRLVDYDPDPGLSASTMLRFRLGPPSAEATDDLLTNPGSRVTIGADTLVLNPDATDGAVVFGTEADLTIIGELDALRLADESTLEPGATTAIEVGETDALLEGDLPLEPGRWLVIVGVDPDDPERLDPDVPGHVVRVTRVERGTDTTRVSWDPRRGAPTRYDRDDSRVYGNTVPAHHGIPLNPIVIEEGVDGDADSDGLLDRDDLLTPWRERLTIRLDGSGVREVAIPVDRVSVHARGWPLPGEGSRVGEPRIALSVDGEPWPRVDALASASDVQVFALRTGPGDTPVARFPAGALPARPVKVDLAVRVGLGTVGNVGVGALTRLLALGPGGDRDALLPADADADRLHAIRQLLRVGNPVPGIGGREPEPLESMRYRAPLGVRDALSAVVPADYERLLCELPEVAAARAVVRAGPLAPVVTTTLLLRDEDTLAASGEQGEAERLRRWATARARLEDVRLLGFDVALVPPRFVPLDLDVSVDVEDWALDTAEHRVTEALAGPNGLFDPDVSGLGGDVHIDAIHHRVLAVPGVLAVRIRHLRRLAPRAPERARAGVLVVDPDEVAIVRHPYGDGFASGLLTVTVCGVHS